MLRLRTSKKTLTHETRGRKKAVSLLARVTEIQLEIISSASTGHLSWDFLAKTARLLGMVIKYLITRVS